MKLYYHPISPFVRKVLICAHENGLEDRIETVFADTRDEALRRINPLCKIPALALEDGTALYDSRVICEYLDGPPPVGLGRGALIPASGPERLRARRLEALGDGIADAALRIAYEMRRPPTERHADVIERQGRAVRAGLAEAGHWVTARRFTLGEASVAAALIYIDDRLPDLDWRGTHPGLAAWLGTVEGRPSLAGTAPVSAH